MKVFVFSMILCLLAAFAGSASAQTNMGELANQAPTAEAGTDSATNERLVLR